MYPVASKYIALSVHAISTSVVHVLQHLRSSKPFVPSPLLSSLCFQGPVSRHHLGQQGELGTQDALTRLCLTSCEMAPSPLIHRNST